MVEQKDKDFNKALNKIPEQYLKEAEEDLWEGYKEYRGNMFIGMIIMVTSWAISSLMSGGIPLVLHFFLLLSIVVIPLFMSIYYIKSLHFFKFRITLLSMLGVAMVFSILSHQPLESNFFS